MKRIIIMMSVLMLVATLVLPAYTAASQTKSEQQKEEMKGEEGTTNVLDDTEITTKVKTKLAADLNIGTVVTIEVNTTNGVVTLAGKVNNEEQKKLAGEIAQGVEGVVKVNNNLQVE